MNEGWSLQRLRAGVYAVAMMVGFLAPLQPASYTGPRTLWVWLGVWQSTMGISSTTGIVLVTWLAVALTALGTGLRLLAAARRSSRLQALGSLAIGLALCILMPPFGALAAAPILIAYEVTVVAMATSPTSRSSASASSVPLLSILLQEVGSLGITLAFAALSWQYNARILEKALLIACGIGLMARAAAPAPSAPRPTDQTSA